MCRYALLSQARSHIQSEKTRLILGYDCLAEQYLHVELVIYLHIKFYRITLANYMMETFLRNASILGHCRYGGWWEGWSMWVEETAREKLSNTNDWA